MHKWLIATLAAVAALLLLTPAPAAAQTADGVLWTVNYYDNVFLMGSPDGGGQLGGPINQNWGPYEPSIGMPRDGWTASISGDAYFPGGRYRFRMLVDDGAQLKVSGIELLNTLDYDQHALGCALYADMTLNEGIHKVEITYIEDEGDASLYFNWYPVPVINTNDPVGYGCNPPNVGDSFSINEIRNNAVPSSVTAPAAATTTESSTAPDTAAVAPAPVTAAFGSARIIAGTLNVRAAPSSSGDVLGKVLFGDFLPVTGQSGDWIEVQYNGQTGYVSSRFVALR